MNHNKFTPGPWFRNIKPASKYTTIWAGRNKHVGYVATQGLSEEEIEANIRLMAAAPTLLAACQLAVDALDSAKAKDPTGYQAKAHAQLLKAIHTAIPE